VGLQKIVETDELLKKTSPVFKRGGEGVVFQSLDPVSGGLRPRNAARVAKMNRMPE
jgi:hypothetical protein